MKAFICLLLAAFSVSDVSARTWQIREDGSGNASTIQAGIDSAAVGDTVLVGPGTYLEHPNFLGKDIVLKSVMGPEVTVLDGSMGLEPRVVGIRNGESRSAVLEGFAITNGTVGVSIRDSEPTVTGNIIEGNSGPGIIGSSSEGYAAFRPLLCGNTIRSNVAQTNGGGIFISPGVAPQIIDNVIENNEATAGDGAGVYARISTPGMIVSGNRIEENFAGDHGGGIYIVWNPGVGSMNHEISWNVIRGNRANGIGGADFEGGGGIYLVQTNAWVHHNTIVENSGALDATGSGGGITLSREENPIIEQNIIAYNPTGKGIACPNSTPVLRNNLVWANKPEDLDPVCWESWPDNGNVVADPDFCDLASGDFSLGINSPALRHPAGPLGAIGVPGCRGTVPVVPTTWGRLKWKFVTGSP